MELSRVKSMLTAMATLTAIPTDMVTRKMLMTPASTTRPMRTPRFKFLLET